MKNDLKKAYFWNTIGSGLNAFNSFFFLIIVTRLNGSNTAGIFTFSFATACMLYIIATYSGRTYQVTETEKDISDNEYIINRLVCSVVMIIISIVFVGINKYNNYKSIIFLLLCIFKATEAICDVFHGILQKNNRLEVVGKSLFLRSLLNILVFYIIDKFTGNIIFSCISLIVINIIILIFYDIKTSLKYKDKNKKINIKSVFKILWLGFYTFGFSFIANYLVNAPRYAIDSIMSEEYQTIFGIVVMPASIIMLINQFLIQPIITLLKESYNKKEKKKFLKLIYKIILITFLIGFASVVIAYLLGIPVLNFVYNLNLNEYKISLILILFGATMYTISCILSNSMIILRKTKIQLLLYILTAIFAYYISNKLISNFAFNGAIYAYISIMSLLLILYILTFIFIINKKEIWKIEE